MSTVEETSTKGPQGRLHRDHGRTGAATDHLPCLLSQSRGGQEAQDKANQLITALEKAGVRAVPSQEQIVGVLGSDGGAICKNPPARCVKRSCSASSQTARRTRHPTGHRR